MRHETRDMRHTLLAALMTLCAVTAATAAPLGVTVNGVMLDSAGSSDTGWAYEPATSNLILSGVGPFTISGTNESGKVQIGVQEGVTSTVTLSNLTLRATYDYDCAFALETNACVSLVLAGTNVLASGSNRAGLEVAAGRTLSITNAPGDDAAMLFATGGYGGAGIGGAYQMAGGTMTINGGQIAAYGNYQGAGIGGGYAGGGGTVTINGGTVKATGGSHAAGIGSGYNGVAGGGWVTINGGEVTAAGGDEGGAGVGGARSSIGGVDGGTSGGTVNITGGKVTATGDGGGAGIGGGGDYNGVGGDGGTVTISGGAVVAKGGSRAAGIGGGGGRNVSGAGGAGATVAISGGTVFAQGDGGAADIGPGKSGTSPQPNTFTGGTISLATSTILSKPTNSNAEQVFCAVVPGFNTNEAVTIVGLGGYGVHDLFADENGCLYLWLPNGTYAFTANGRDCTVKIENGVGPVGVTVNGEDVASGPADPGAGWSYDATTFKLTLSGAGPYTLSGFNGAGAVCVYADYDSAPAVTLSNLTLRATGENQCAFTLGGNSHVSLTLAGRNELVSGIYRPGIWVPLTRTLSITNAPGDEAASLSATGGRRGAGIGSCANEACGAVNINGGVITATGGFDGAGIGGGYRGKGGLVTIRGGTVTATGSPDSAGIGGGDEAVGGTLTVYEGTVVANGGTSAAGIGGGRARSGGTVKIFGGTVTATGGASGGAGIGGGAGYSSTVGGAGGTVEISGGTVTATGGTSSNAGGAGIGGGGGYSGSSGGEGGTVEISGGTVTATGGYCAAGIGSAYKGVGGTVTISDGTVTATGAYQAAGIGGGYRGTGGMTTIEGGVVAATGGDSGAGIGGGDSGNGGTVTISGGAVTATGGAGIGGGYGFDKGGAGGIVNISGGHVTATGNSGAGIGGGNCYYANNAGAGAAVTVSGGTVFARGNGGADMGPGGNAAAGSNTFTGGSLRLTPVPAPSNNTEQVFCATLTGFAAGGTVEFTSRGTLPDDYGTEDIVADEHGIIYLWLPNGTYTFTANGRDCTLTIQDGVGPTGVTVNDEEAAYGPADPLSAGWRFDTTNRTVLLSGQGPFTLSGYNVIGTVCIAVTNGVTSTVTFSNLTLRATGSGQCAFALETNAVVSLYFAGESDLTSAKYRAGVEVPTGASLAITNAPGDDVGALTVTGGYGGAGIGGGYDANGGVVTVNGGTLTVAGGFAGAGIGGGYNYSNIPNADTDSGGTVTVNGGAITVTSGNYAAGIGGGAFGGGGTVTVNGGVVTATSGYGGAGIGGGYNANGGAVTVNDGALTATGGHGGAGIGGGYNYSNIPNAETNSGGTVTINGGTVSAIGGRYAAGIGSGDYGGGGTVNISGGTVTATGGFDGAGIGGGYDGQGCTVTITGGGVSATGGDYAAGIGGGYTYNSTAATAAAGGTMNISGGRVMATGGRYAAGIGGGSGWTVEGGDGATLTVAGGTVFATGGADGGPGIGSGVGNVGNGGSAPHVSGSCTFTGGSIRIDGGYAATDPTDGANRVWCVTVTNLTPHAVTTVTGLGTYGVTDLFADENGRLYFWLPDNDYTFEAGGSGYTAAVNGAAATATLYLAAPVFATDGSGIVVSGTTLSITITNAQSGAYYALYWAPEPGGPWTLEQSVPATADGLLTFTLSNMTAPKRFFKVEASTDQP